MSGNSSKLRSATTINGLGMTLRFAARCTSFAYRAKCHAVPPNLRSIKVNRLTLAPLDQLDGTTRLK